jgi:hypothetical protein
MFTEFVHPELVLFGNFMNSKIGCQHPIEAVNGEIVVHQIINRIWNPNGLLKPTGQKRSKEEEEYEHELDQDEREYLEK